MYFLFKLSLGILVILAALGVFTYVSETKVKEAKYQQGLEYIAREDYQNAGKTLRYMKYKDSEILEAYCEAKIAEQAGRGLYVIDFELAPVKDDYAGAYAEEILAYKKSIALQIEMEAKAWEDSLKAKETKASGQNQKNTGYSYSSGSGTKNSAGSSKKKSSKKTYTYNDAYDEGYEDIWLDDDFDWDRYDRDEDYARGVDDAMEDEDW